MVCLEVPEPHIRVLWGTQFMTPSSAQPTPEDGKVLAFAKRYLPWTAPDHGSRPDGVACPRRIHGPAYDIDGGASGTPHPRLAVDTQQPDRVSVLWVSLSPLSLFHLLIVSPFLSPSNVWHIIHAKANLMGITQQVAPFMDWMRAETVEPQQGIASLTSMDLADSTLAQRQGIRTTQVPPPLHTAMS